MKKWKNTKNYNNWYELLIAIKIYLDNIIITIKCYEKKILLLLYTILL